MVRRCVRHGGCELPVLHAVGAGARSTAGAARDGRFGGPAPVRAGDPPRRRLRARHRARLHRGGQRTAAFGSSGRWLARWWSGGTSASRSASCRLGRRAAERSAGGSRSSTTGWRTTRRPIRTGRPMDHTDALDTLEAPVLLQGGWYDLFADVTTSQYESLRRRGQQPYLTMGPWTHRDFGSLAWRTLMPETLSWLHTHLGGSDGGDGSGPRLRAKPVRVFVLGAGEWRDVRRLAPTRAVGAALVPPARSSARARLADRHRRGPVPVQPRRPHAVGRWGVAVLRRRSARQPRARGATRRADLHERAVRGTADDLRRATRGAVLRHDVADDRRLRAALRRGTGRALAERVRRTRSPLPRRPRTCRRRPGARASSPCHRRRAPSPTATGCGSRCRAGRIPATRATSGTGEPTATATTLMAGDQVVCSGPDHPSSVTVLAE